MRSRLEARWACFFDALETPWLYESQRYTMAGQYAYTPDFHLPDIAVIVEVKPKLIVDIPTMEKYSAYGPELVSRGECKMYVLCVGSPAPLARYAACGKYGFRTFSFEPLFGKIEVECAALRASRLHSEDIAKVRDPSPFDGWTHDQIAEWYETSPDSPKRR